MENENNTKTKLTPKRKKILIITSIALAAIVVLAIIISTCGGDKSLSNYYNLWGKAKEAVCEQLIAPSTAKFPPFDSEFIKELGEGKYEINSHVDCQNGFGTYIRRKFTVTIIEKEWGSDEVYCVLH